MAAVDVSEKWVEAPLLVDEAGACTEPEAWIPLTRLKRGGVGVLSPPGPAAAARTRSYTGKGNDDLAFSVAELRNSDCAALGAKRTLSVT